MLGYEKHSLNSYMCYTDITPVSYKGLPEERAAREEECQIIRIFIQPELEIYIQNTSEKMHVNARKCMN